MSDIDQWFRNSKAHAGFIIAPPSATIDDRESVDAPAQMQGSVMPQTYSASPPIERPRCSRCTSGMKLALIIHGPMTFENRRFECPKCNYVQNQIVATDPMQSAYLGWLAGELMAPK